MKGRESVKGEYDGESLTVEGILLGEEDFCEENLGWEMAGVRSLALGAFIESEAGGTGLLGVLGTGARIPFGFLELGSRTGCS
jgi:hypothetical protein